MEIIGMTKCDDDRKAREEEANQLWNSLTSSNGFVQTYAMFHSAIDLFREVGSCYQNGAYMATAIMCRSVIETVIWYTATRNITAFEEKGIATKMDIKILNDDEFGKVLEEVKLRYKIKGSIEAEIGRIRNKGNFVAHYGSIVDKRDVKDIHALVYWLNRNEAKELIKKTVKIVTYLYSQVVPA